MTLLTPKNILSHKIHNTAQIVDAVFGVSPTPPVTWILPVTSVNFEDDSDGASDSDDLPHFDSANDMMADIIADENDVSITVDIDWALPVCCSTTIQVNRIL